MRFLTDFSGSTRSVTVTDCSLVLSVTVRVPLQLQVLLC